MRSCVSGWVKGCSKYKQQFVPFLFSMVTGISTPPGFRSNVFTWPYCSWEIWNNNTQYCTALYVRYVLSLLIYGLFWGHIMLRHYVTLWWSWKSVTVLHQIYVYKILDVSWNRFQCLCFYLLISNVVVFIYLFPMLLFLSDPTVLTLDHSLPESSYRSHPLHCLYNPADLEALWPHPKYREINKNTVQSFKPIKNSIHFALGENSVKTI